MVTCLDSGRTFEGVDVATVGGLVMGGGWVTHGWLTLNGRGTFEGVDVAMVGGLVVVGWFVCHCWVMTERLSGAAVP